MSCGTLCVTVDSGGIRVEGEGASLPLLLRRGLNVRRVCLSLGREESSRVRDQNVKTNLLRQKFTSIYSTRKCLICIESLIYLVT